ncbi:tetracycline resistance efflux system leader peptide [Succiniclasticum sp.]
MYDVCLCNKMNRTQLQHLPEKHGRCFFYNNSFIISKYRIFS